MVCAKVPVNERPEGVIDIYSEVFDSSEDSGLSTEPIPSPRSSPEVLPRHGTNCIFLISSVQNKP